MSECEVCYNNYLKSDIKCQRCKKGICSNCYITINKSGVIHRKDKDMIDISYKCPYCRENVLIEDINDNNLLKKMLIRSLKEEGELIESLNEKDVYLSQQNQILKKVIYDANNSIIIEDLKEIIKNRLHQEKKVLRIEEIESILNTDYLV